MKAKEYGGQKETLLGDAFIVWKMIKGEGKREETNLEHVINLLTVAVCHLNSNAEALLYSS